MYVCCNLLNILNILVVSYRNHVHESYDKIQCPGNSLCTSGIDSSCISFLIVRVQQRNKKSSWSPFATKRRPPSPPQESLFDNPDAAVVAEVLRATINPKPRRAHNDKDY